METIISSYDPYYYHLLFHLLFPPIQPHFTVLPSTPLFNPLHGPVVLLSINPRSEYHLTSFPSSHRKPVTCSRYSNKTCSNSRTISTVFLNAALWLNAFIYISYNRDWIEDNEYIWTIFCPWFCLIATTWLLAWPFEYCKKLTYKDQTKPEEDLKKAKNAATFLYFVIFGGNKR